MFIAQGFKKENSFASYLFGSFLLFLAANIGSIPLVVVTAIYSHYSGKPMPTGMDGFATYFDSNLYLALMLLSFVFVLAALFLILKKSHNQNMLSITTSRPKVDWKRVAFSFIIWGAFLIVSVIVAYFLNPEEYVLNFKPIPFLILVVVVLLLIPIQTSVEELVFRGYLMQGFGNLAENKWFPLLMTTLIFGGMHYWNPEVSRVGNLIMLEYLAVGLFLGVITLMDEGLELALGFHAANNIFGALLITADWTAFQTDSILKSVSEPTYGFTDVLLLLITYPVLLYIFSKRYNWTNWKEKLTGKITANSTSNSI